MSRYFIGCYYRLSQEDEQQEESNSIQNQRKIIYEYIRHKEEFLDSFIMEYSDDGITGTGSYRPGLNALIESIKKGEINCVIVKDASRLGRNYIDTGLLQEKFFPEYGVRFISILEGYDSGMISPDSMGLAFANIANDFYSKDLSDKIKSVKYTKARKGEIGVSFAVYGFKKNPADKYGFLIDEMAAGVVKKIFSLCESGLSTSDIAEYLNKEKLLPPGLYKKEHGLSVALPYDHEDRKWNPSIVYRILRNERYTGIGIFGQTSRIIPGRKETAQKKPQEQWVIQKNYYPVIICKEQFDHVQEILQSKTGKKRGISNEPRTDNLFKGKVYCGGCGLTAGTGKNGYGIFYRCPTKKIRRTESCPSKVVHTSTICEIVLYSLNCYIETFLDKVNEVKEDEILVLLRKKEQSILAEIDRLKCSKIELYESYAGRCITKEVYLQEKEHTSSTMQELYQNLEENSVQINQREEILEKRKFLLGIRDSLKCVDPKLVDTFIKKILLYPDRIKIIWTFDDPFRP